MIKLTRIDDRLVHGQVAFTWTPAIGANCLIVANDRVAKDDFLKMTLALAKPQNAILQILSLDKTISFVQDAKNQNLKILLIVDSVKDAAYLANSVVEINSINFGGIRIKENAKLITKAIALNSDDIAIINDLLSKQIELEIRQVPTDKKQLVKDLI